MTFAAPHSAQAYVPTAPQIRAAWYLANQHMQPWACATRPALIVGLSLEEIAAMSTAQPERLSVLPQAPHCPDLDDSGHLWCVTPGGLVSWAVDDAGNVVVHAHRAGRPVIAALLRSTQGDHLVSAFEVRGPYRLAHVMALYQVFDAVMASDSAFRALAHLWAGAQPDGGA